MTRLHFVLAFAWIAGAAHAHSMFRYDMGGTNTPVQSTFQQVTELTLYDPLQGQPYGWTAVGTLAVADHTLSPLVANNGRRVDLLRDSVRTVGSQRSLTFKADVPAGTYRCVVYLGDAGVAANVYCDSGHTPLEHLSLMVDTGDGQGLQSLGTELKVHTMHSKGASKPEQSVPGGTCLGALTGGYLKVRCILTVPPGPNGPGTVCFRFGCAGAAFSYVSVQGIELAQCGPLPIQFEHAAQGGVGGLVVDPLYPYTEAQDFADSMNVGDYANARNAIESLTEETVEKRLTKACGRLWLAGWIDGSEEGLLDGDPRDQDLANAIALLAGDADTDLLAEDLLDEALDFQLALFFDRARGYTADVVPGSLDDPALAVNAITANLGAGEQLYRQLQGDFYAASDQPFLETSPLHPRAEYLRATQYFMRSPTSVPGDVDGYPNTAQRWHDMIEAISQRIDLFPGAVDLQMFTFMLQYDSIYTAYPANQILPHSYIPEDAWWSDFVAPVDTSGAPQWAALQRRCLRGLQSVADWWIDRRLLDGQLGGGGGDDVELVGQLYALPRVLSPENGYFEESPTEQGLRAACDAVLLGAEVNQDKGYFDGVADVEHTGEYTTDTLFGLLPAYFGDGTYYEFPLRTMGNTLQSVAGAGAWTAVYGTASPEQRHFRSYEFGLQGGVAAVNLGSPGGPAVQQDVPLSFRSISPAFTLADYNEHPEVVDVLLRLARAWRADCLSTAQGKPIGIPPAGVHMDAGSVGLFGADGVAWWDNGYTNNAVYLEYVYTLLLTAYRHSTETDRADYLKPIFEAAKWMVAFDGTSIPADPPAGSDLWVVKNYRTIVMDSLQMARPDLYATSLPQTTPQNDKVVLDSQLVKYGSPWTAYVVSKKKANFLAKLELSADWLDYFFPLATEAVAYTDRAALGYAKELLYAQVSGNPWSSNPRPVVTWESPDSGQPPLDVALLVARPDPPGYSAQQNGVPFDPHELRLLVYNFGAGDRDVTFRVWNDLDFGEYDLTVGPDQNNDDVPDPGDPLTTVEHLVSYGTRGQAFTVTALGDGPEKLTAIRLQYTGPNGASVLFGQPDVAIGRHDVTAGAGGTISVRVHNLTSVATDVPVTVEIRLASSGALLGSAVGDPLPGAALGQPAVEDVAVNVGAPLPTQPIEVRLVFTRAQLTELNDVVTLTLP